METVLMVVTLVSLSLAIGMSVLAWRLLRDDRQRSGARSDALREMASTLDEDVDEDPEPEIRRALPARAVEPRTSVRQSPQIEPSFDEMRLTSAEDEFQPETEWDAPLAHPSRHVRLPPSRSRHHAPAPVPEPTFSATEERGVPGRRWAALAVVAVIMAGTAGAVYLYYSPLVTGVVSSSRELASPASSPGVRPIELLSLRHAADNDGTFTVTGLVQNPVDGRLARRVIAVVYVFDRDGNYFASGKAALDFTALQPGEESPFVVRIPNVGRVSRYRVGFRSEEGGVVAHVDRRGQLPGGTTGDAIEARPLVTPATSARRSEG